MSWFKIDDGMHSHPKTLAAGNEAIGLWARCGSYCSQHLTEGRVPRAVALMYGDMHLIDTLVKVGLFEPIEDDWLIHDYHDYNPTKDKVLSDREAAAARQRAAREKARLAREAKAAKEAADAKRHADSHGVTSSVNHAVNHADSHTADDAQREDRHGVTYAAAPSRPEVITVPVEQGPEEAPGVAPVQDIADAPSRRDSRQQSRAPRPDPTRPVLPTEVREEQNLSAPDALFAIDESERKPRADKPRESEGPTAQTFIGEWLEGCAEDDMPTKRIIGRVGKEIKTLIAEGARPEDIRQGLADWDGKGDSPASLPSFVNGARRRRRQAEQGYPQGSGIPGQRTSVDQRVMGTLATAKALAEECGEIPPEPGVPPLATVTYLPLGEFAS